MNKNNILFPILLILMWQVLSATGVLPPYKIPSPLEIVLAGKELIVSGLPHGSGLLSHLGFSLVRVLCGFCMAVLIALPCGIMIGWSSRLRHVITPVIEMIRPIPPLAWIPLAILWFGIGLKSAAFIIFLGCFFPILLSTISGVSSVDSNYIDAARTLGARGNDIFMKILVPASIPSIFTGLRIGMGIGWMTLVAAEYTGVKSGFGLGYMIMTARDIQRPDYVIAGMAAIGLVGYLLDILLRFFEQ
ncbi:MAG: ABC transporter permease, partial [Deltaproteobacteria bacterium]|nr:ABC transporter permease [Deltaproteobacteria bacterium]